ncbi:MAG: hypothetical protein U9R19_06945 [Bacteroidota bacterium]|nr:hypothetical protein [Bacteroidota bacterium]
MVVAGKEPSLEIKKKIAKKENWELIENPGDIEMQRLIQQAHICFIPTFQSTGLKLKLLSSLFSGRFVITNSQMVNNTGLEQLCIIGNSAEELNSLIRQTMKKDFTQNEIEKRESVINENFSNKKVAKNLLRIITDGEK